MGTIDNEEKRNLPAVIPKQPDYSLERSEEVQSIIERMPTYWTKWVVLCLGILMGMIILLGFIIKYPDTVGGQVSVTAETAPVRLVANTTGRLILLEPDKAHVEKGSVISYIESGAFYRHILWVDSLLDNSVTLENEYHPLPDSLLLGDVASAYNAFVLSYQQYCRVLASDIYATMRQNLQNQINSDRLVIENLDEELKLKANRLMDSEDRLKKDSILLEKQVISEQDYRQQRASHLSLKESRLNLQSNRLLKQSEISRKLMEIQRIHLEETENRERVYSEYIVQKSALANTVSLWKERYLQYSPVEGELEYLGFGETIVSFYLGRNYSLLFPIRIIFWVR